MNKKRFCLFRICIGNNFVHLLKFFKEKNTAAFQSFLIQYSNAIWFKPAWNFFLSFRSCQSNSPNPMSSSDSLSGSGFFSSFLAAGADEAAAAGAAATANLLGSFKYSLVCNKDNQFSKYYMLGGEKIHRCIIMQRLLI